jgi:hypothetical protein
VANATRVFRERSGLNHLRQVDSPAINIPPQSAPYLVFGYLAHSTHHSAFIIQHSAFQFHHSFPIGVSAPADVAASRIRRRAGIRNERRSKRTEIASRKSKKIQDPSSRIQDRKSVIGNP